MAGLVIFVLAALYYSSFCTYGVNLWDEGGMYAGGLRYLDGQRVFDDFEGYSPGRYYIVSWLFSLFGTEMLPVRYFFALATAFFPVLSFQICRRLMPPAYCIFATALVASAPAVYYQRFFGFLMLFNAWAAIVFLEDRRRFFWPLFAVILTIFLRLELVMPLLPVYGFLLYVFLDIKRKTLLPAAAVLALFALLLALSDLGRSLFLRVFTEYMVWSNPLPALFEGYQGRDFGLIAFLENILFYIPFIVGGILFMLGVKEEDGRRRNILLVLSYLQVSAMMLIVFRAGFDNLVRCLPLFFIAASYLAYRLVDFLGKGIREMAAKVFLAYLWGLYMVVFNVYNGFYTGSIGAIREADTMIKSGRAAGVYAWNMDEAIISNVTKWITEETSPQDTIFAVPLNPIWYYLTDRKNPTYYDWVLPGTLHGPEEERKLLDELKGSPPAVIILVNLKIDNRPERSIKFYAPQIVNWIAENYEYGGRVAYFQIWRKSD